MRILHWTPNQTDGLVHGRAAEVAPCVMYSHTLDVGDQIFLAEASCYVACFFALRLLWNRLSLYLSFLLETKECNRMTISAATEYTFPKSYPIVAKLLLWRTENIAFKRPKFCMFMHLICDGRYLASRHWIRSCL